MPDIALACVKIIPFQVVTAYSHCRMQRSCNFIVLLEPRTAPQNLRQPKLADSALHVSDFPLGWRRGLHPLRRLPADAAYHVCMRQGLRRPLTGLGLAHGARHGLCDSGVQGRGPIRDNQIVVSAGRSRLARPRSGGEGRGHGEGVVGPCVKPNGQAAMHRACVTAPRKASCR